MNLSIIALSIFFSVLSLIFGIKARRDRDPVLEKILRSQKKMFFFGDGIIKALQRFWHTEGDSVISFSKAVNMGVVSSVSLVFILLITFRPTATGSVVFLFLIGIAMFLVVPVLYSLVLKEILVKQFQGEAEFIAETIVAVLTSTGGDMKEAVKHTTTISTGKRVKKEFMRVAQDVDSGKTVAGAFSSLSRRIPCRETEDLADAAELFETVGGASSLDLFQNVTAVFKENAYNRVKVKKKFRATKIQAGIIGLLPLLCTAFLMSQHSWAVLLFSTDQGRNAVALAAIIYAVAAFSIYFLFKRVDLN